MSSFEQSLNPCKKAEENGVIRLCAAAGTDFVRPFGTLPKDDAAFFFTNFSGDFTFSGELETLGKATYDAAFLMVRKDETQWLKLAVELSCDGRYNAVSVITDGFSDDANGELLQSGCASLRITRKGSVFGLHFREAASKWRFVRTFYLDLPREISVGFGIQSPKGYGCEGTFRNLKLVQGLCRIFGVANNIERLR